MNILENVYRLINKYNQQSKTPKRYGTEDVLYLSEVHMIEVIGFHEGITTTRLAEKLGITKGAVSQTVRKLEKKSLIEKQHSKEKTNEVFISLSAKGRVILKNHRKLHEKMLTDINEVIKDLPEESKSAMKEILNIIDLSLDRLGGN